MPPRLARFVIRIVIALACGVLVWAVTVAAGHVPLEGGTFEFGHPQRVAGTIVERPYPALQIDGADSARHALAAPGRPRQAWRGSSWSADWTAVACR